MQMVLPACEIGEFVPLRPHQAHYVLFDSDSLGALQSCKHLPAVLDTGVQLCPAVVFNRSHVIWRLPTGKMAERCESCDICLFISNIFACRGARRMVLTCELHLPRRHNHDPRRPELHLDGAGAWRSSSACERPELVWCLLPLSVSCTLSSNWPM